MSSVLLSYELREALYLKSASGLRICERRDERQRVQDSSCGCYCC